MIPIFLEFLFILVSLFGFLLQINMCIILVLLGHVFIFSINNDHSLIERIQSSLHLSSLFFSPFSILPNFTLITYVIMNHYICLVCMQKEKIIALVYNFG